MLAAFMALAVATPAFAAAGDQLEQPEDTVTVTGLTAGDVANFYQVVEWVGSADGNVKGWAAVSPFDTLLTEAKLTEVLVGTPATDDTAAVPATGITAELAGQLAKLAGDSTAQVTVAEGATQAQLADVDPGLYMVLITPADDDVVYNPVFVAADYKEDGNSWEVTDELSYSDEAAAKKSTVELEKTAEAADEEDLQWQTLAIGDQVNFTVTTKIPAFADIYTHPVFIVRDALTDLTLLTDTVELVEPAGLVEDVDYTIDADESGYTIEFSEDYLLTVGVPTDVEITYSALVATTAELHVNIEKNEVSTEFSHNPSDESDHGFKRDTTQHYTFTIDADGIGGGGEEHHERTSEIVKVGVDANGDPIKEEHITSQIDEEQYWQGPLEGVTFKLYTDADCTQEYIAKNADGTEAGPLTIVTDEDGRMTIPGLDAGDYWLMEDDAPDGYVTSTEKVHIEIIAETEEITVTEYTLDGETWISQEEFDELDADTQATYKSYTFETDVLVDYIIKINGEEMDHYHFEQFRDPVIDWVVYPPVEIPYEIINTQGAELPSTGGMGTRILYAVGGIMIAAGGIFLVSKRRLSSME